MTFEKEDDEERRRARTRRVLVAVAAVLLAVAAAAVYVGLVYRGPAPYAAAEGSDGAAADRSTPARGGTATRRTDRASGSTDAPLAIPADVVPFPTLDGDTASLADYRGQVVVLNLWGTWCPPCREEIPDLVRLQEAIAPRGGVVVGLAVDSGSRSEIRSFAEEFGIDYPIWMSDTGTVVDHYRPMGFPTTLVIDREGIIRRRYLGPQTEASLLEGLEPYLEG